MLIGGPNMLPFVGENKTHQSIFFLSANGQTTVISWEVFELALASQCSMDTLGFFLTLSGASEDKFTSGPSFPSSSRN